MQTHRRVGRMVWPLAFWIATAAGADVLVTRDGHQIETEGPWEIRGRQVVFTVEGRLSSIRLAELDREASEEATRQAAAAAAAASEESEAVEEPEEEEVAPFARVILESYAAEKKESVLSITHKDIPATWPDDKDPSAAEKQMARFKEEVREAIERLDLLAVSHDLRAPEGIRAAAGEIREIADEVGGLLRKRLPRTFRGSEHWRGVLKLAQELERLAALARSDPEAAVRMLDTLGWWD